VDITPLPFRAGLDDYNKQAEQLLEAWKAGDPAALRIFHDRHPRFLDEQIKWLPKRLSDDEIRSAPLDLSDARLTVARWYDFQSWQALAEYVQAVTPQDSPVAKFESAVEAVVNGDLPTLQALLRDNPELVRARSTRVEPHDPPVHGATLLHYVAANAVEGYRQKTPKNAVEIAKALLDAGAEPDALAAMYGGQCTTMSMLVSSCHPAEAGLQVALVDVLVDYGAAVESRGSGDWNSPLMTALAFGYRDAAEALIRRGAQVKNIAEAAALGRLDDVRQLLSGAGAEARHRSIALAAQHGQTEIVRLLLDAGEDPNRYNPKGNHGHSTPLHQAIAGGHADVVRLLVERGARLDIQDTIYQGTPLGWAEYCGKKEIAEYLQGQGAPR
jgi:ankyrin repeat protein